MHRSDIIENFVREALAKGQESDAISAALIDAGWSKRETDDALSRWVSSGPNLPPVPCPRPYVSAREAALYGLLFVSLAMVCWYIVWLGFAVIGRLFPDEWGRPAPLDEMRKSIASLVVFLPLFLILDRRARRARRACMANPGRRCSVVRGWGASVSLLVAVLLQSCDHSAARMRGGVSIGPR